MGKVTRKQFKLHQRVRWTSQAGGHYKTKEGMIVFVVPSGIRPDMVREAGLPRNHESYVVSAEGQNYWPRVSALEEVPDTSTVQSLEERSVAEPAR